MDPFIGQISTTAFNFAPRGWMLCDGQALPIAQYQALFAILGTTYGGDGVRNFNLPDLRGRAAVCAGQATVIGEAGGTEAVALNATQIPSHTHNAQAISAAGTSPSPSGGVWAKSANNANQFVVDKNPSVPMAASASGPGGQGQAHPNMPPMLVLNFIIAFQGIFPSRN